MYFVSSDGRRILLQRNVDASFLSGPQISVVFTTRVEGVILLIKMYTIFSGAPKVMPYSKGTRRAPCVKCSLNSTWILIIQRRRSHDRLIFIMGILLTERTVLYWNSPQSLNVVNGISLGVPLLHVTAAMGNHVHLRNIIRCDASTRNLL